MIYTFLSCVPIGGKQTFIYQASKDWNNLDNDIKNSKSLSLFKAKLKVAPYSINRIFTWRRMKN